MAIHWNTEKLNNIRHTLAHLTAQAVRELYPGAKNAIGPVIENGWYQDFDLGEIKLSDSDLQKIENKIKENLKTWESFSKKDFLVVQLEPQIIKSYDSLINALRSIEIDSTGKVDLKRFRWQPALRPEKGALEKHER